MSDGSHSEIDMDLSFPMPPNKPEADDAETAPADVVDGAVAASTDAAPSGESDSHDADAPEVGGFPEIPQSDATPSAPDFPDVPASSDGDGVNRADTDGGEAPDLLQRAAERTKKPAKPSVPRVQNGDVVDTFWDIPPIEFPGPEPGEEAKDGPRHAAPKGVPSTAETRVIASRNASTVASAFDGTETGTAVLGTPLPSADAGMAFPVSDEKTEVIGAPADGDTSDTVIGAFPIAPTTPTDASQETSVLDGTKLFPETGPAAQETVTIGGTMPTLAFGDIVSGNVGGASAETAAIAEPTTADDGAQPSGDAGAASQEPPIQPAKRSFKPVAIVVVVLIVAVAVGGMLLWRNRESDEDRTAALSACTGASEEYNDAKEALDQALAGAKDEQAITADQVADAATVDALKTAVDDANGIDEAAACGTSLSARDLQRNSRTNQDLTKQLNDSADAVTAAAKAVSDSRDAKTAADKTSTREALQNAVNDAQTLLNNSLWAVADNSTRVTLEEAINAANDLLQQDDPDLTAMQDAQTALQNASDGVNASMEALSAQTAQQQNMTTDNGYGYYSYNPPYGGNTTGDTMTGDAAMGDVANGGTGGGLDTGTGDADDGSETPDSVPSEPTEEGGAPANTDQPDPQNLNQTQ